MSFTVLYTKDGVERPIKLSFFDAFRGVPDLKPKPQPCKCCGKVHAKGSGAKYRCGEHPKPAGKDAHRSSGGGSKSFASTKDDEIIRRMKAENKSHKDIASALGWKDVGRVKIRWREINGGTQATNGHDPGERATQAARKKDERERKAAERRATAATAADTATSGETGTGLDAKTAASTSTKSAGYDIKKLAQQYDTDKWLAVASRHFDKTGERISPEEARKMVEAR